MPEGGMPPSEGTPVPSSPRFDRLVEILQANPRASLEDLVASIPAPDRDHFALMYRSRGLQEASLSDPRVILYGPDARFIVTFNGDAAQAGQAP